MGGGAGAGLTSTPTTTTTTTATTTNLAAAAAAMNISPPPVRSSTSRRNLDSRTYFTSYTPPSSTEAINGPAREPREPVPASDRLIVGVDFGTTFSG